MNNETKTTLHQVSETLGSLMAQAYSKGGKDYMSLLEAYRAVRRCLPYEDNGKRFCSKEAYISCQK